MGRHNRVAARAARDPGGAGASPRAAPKVRERPQDAEPVAQPWSARSYAAGSPLPPVANANLPKPAAARNLGHSQPTVHYPPAPQDHRAAGISAAPVLSETGRDPTSAASRRRSGKTAKRVLIAALGLFLAAGIVGSLISRQNLRRLAEQKPRRRARTRSLLTPVATPVQSSAARGSRRLMPQSARNARSRRCRESRSFRQADLERAGAHALGVRPICPGAGAGEPGFGQRSSNEDARSWKKKIREAQAAEAALK